MPKRKGAEAAEAESLSGRLGEFGSAVMQIAEEKNLPREKVFEIVEAALAAAYKKDYGKKGQVIKSKFDEVTKSADFFLVKEVVDETMRDFTVEEEPEEGAPEKEKMPGSAISSRSRSKAMRTSAVWLLRPPSRSSFSGSVKRSARRCSLSTRRKRGRQ